MAERHLLRPAGFDDLGLRRALGDRMLPSLVAAMAFLAALALAGSIAAAALARHWQEGAAAALTVQVPQPAAPSRETAADGRADARLARVVAILRGTPGIAGARVLGDGELADLLRPWLGDDAERMALPLPAVIDVHLAGEGQADGPDLAALAAHLTSAAPGTLVESHGVWVERLAALARSLEACAWAALLVVAAVAAAVIALAARTGLVARREAIEIVHGLGATDGYIAGRFARRAAALSAMGGAIGAAAALPVLLGLATLAAPFVGGGDAAVAAATTYESVFDIFATLPATIWLALPLLPALAWAIGFATAQGTVRRWLRRLP
jgi:cell division transport system permease protein